MWMLIMDGAVQELTDVDPAGRYHPDLVWLAAPNGTKIGDQWDGTQTSAPSSPALTLADRRFALANYRYGKEIAGIMFHAVGAPGAALLGTGRDDQAKLTAAFTMAGSGHWVDGTPWKMADGTFVPMLAADIQGAAIKAATYIALCYAHEATISAALANNLESDISVGWPANT